MNNDRWQSDDDFEVPLTPLVDIIFILIVFFLVATTFYSEERDLNVKLPEGAEGDLVEQQKGVFVINIRKEGAVVVGKEILSLDELDAKLSEVGKRESPRVEVRGDTDARHGRIMAVMNLCKKNDISNYALTQRETRTVE